MSDEDKEADVLLRQRNSFRAALEQTIGNFKRVCKGMEDPA